jgi:hypothetical protein
MTDRAHIRPAPATAPPEDTDAKPPPEDTGDISPKKIAAAIRFAIKWWKPISILLGIIASLTEAHSMLKRHDTELARVAVEVRLNALNTLMLCAHLGVPCIDPQPPPATAAVTPKEK